MWTVESPCNQAATLNRTTATATLLIASKRPLGIASYDACRKHPSLLNFAIGRPHGEGTLLLMMVVLRISRRAWLRSAMWTAVEPQTVDRLWARRPILLSGKHLSGY